MSELDVRRRKDTYSSRSLAKIYIVTTLYKVSNNLTYKHV